MFMNKAIVLSVILFSITCYLTACKSGSSSTKETTDTLATNVIKKTKKQKPDSLTQMYALGKRLFDNSCLQCHQTSDERMVGPGLKGVFERRSVDWITRWIENSQKMIADGDPYAVKIYNEYNKSAMLSFGYKGKDMQALLFYMANVNRGNQPYITLDKLPKVKD